MLVCGQSATSSQQFGRFLDDYHHTPDFDPEMKHEMVMTPGMSSEMSETLGVIDGESESGHDVTL